MTLFVACGVLLQAIYSFLFSVSERFMVVSGSISCFDSDRISDSIFIIAGSMPAKVSEIDGG